MLPIVIRNYKRIYSENHKRTYRKGLKYSYEYIVTALSDEASKSDEQEGECIMLEVMDEMAIREKEMKLLMNFVKDDLKEARDSEDVEKKNSKIDRVLEHIQQYLED